MNGTYYQNPTFPQNNNNFETPLTNQTPPGNISSMPMEQSYIENILRLNKEIGRAHV